MCMGKVFFSLYQMMINQDAVQGISSEATEFFDSFLNEGIILKSLKESAEEKTIVLVSHRVSTMNMADVVYEMENGRIS